MGSSRHHLELGCAEYERRRFKSAIRHFRMASRIGIAEAQVNLGNMHDAGEGTKPNPRLAVHYYKLAVRKGVPEAAYNLAVTYRRQGRSRWASYWLRRACELGDIDAQEALASGTWNTKPVKS
jgi:TPR repeat protein